MPWKRMPAYVTGEVEESLLLRLERLGGLLNFYHREAA